MLFSDGLQIIALYHHATPCQTLITLPAGYYGTMFAHVSLFRF